MTEPWSQPLIDQLDAGQRDRLTAAGVRLSSIGTTAAGRQLVGCSIGDADLPLVSIVAGAHPDEPAGPLAALRLLQDWSANPLADQVRLAVVPQLDIDGAADQAEWLQPWDGAMDLPRFLHSRQRRPPGADREFAWPGAPWGGTVLPECAAAAAFLDQAGPAIAHLSLHGMSVAQGAWYLLDRSALPDARLWHDLRASAQARGFGLHEFHRYGDKGFRRVGHGFCTTPSGPAMRRFFLAAGDPATAAGFGYGSMDSARSRATRQGRPAPLCAVSEFPLLEIPASIAPDANAARELLTGVATAADPERAATELLAQPGIRAVPLDDQIAGMTDMIAAVAAAALRRPTAG